SSTQARAVAYTITRMPHRTLSDFLETLSREGQLVRVAAEVDAELEVAEITDRTVKAGGPALLFEKVRGRSGVLVTNLFGTTPRLCQAVGVHSPEALVERLAWLTETGGRQSWLDRLKARSSGPPLERFPPKTVKAGPVQQVVRLGRDVDLAQLPLPRCWP